MGESNVQTCDIISVFSREKSYILYVYEVSSLSGTPWRATGTQKIGYLEHVNTGNLIHFSWIKPTILCCVIDADERIFLAEKDQREHTKSVGCFNWESSETVNQLVSTDIARLMSVMYGFSKQTTRGHRAFEVNFWKWSSMCSIQSALPQHSTDNIPQIASPHSPVIWMELSWRPLQDRVNGTTEGREGDWNN